MTHEERMHNLCVNLRRLRAEHGLSKRQMARILGVGIRTLDTLESGVVPRRLGGGALFRAADYFHVSSDALFEAH